MTIVLQEADNQLDEVVAQGYSNTTKRLSTSSVSKATSAELGRQTEMNPLLALQEEYPEWYSRQLLPMLPVPLK